MPPPPLLPSLPHSPSVVQYHSAARSPENQHECSHTSCCQHLSRPPPALVGRANSRHMPGNEKSGKKEPSPLTGRLRLWQEWLTLLSASTLPCLAKPASKRREKWDTRPLLLLSSFYTSENQVMVGLRHTQDSNSGLLISMLCSSIMIRRFQKNLSNLNNLRMQKSPQS